MITWLVVVSEFAALHDVAQELLHEILLCHQLLLRSLRSKEPVLRLQTAYVLIWMFNKVRQSKLNGETFIRPLKAWTWFLQEFDLPASYSNYQASTGNSWSWTYHWRSILASREADAPSPWGNRGCRWSLPALLSARLFCRRTFHGARGYDSVFSISSFL